MRIHSWGQATGAAGAQALCGSGPRRPRCAAQTETSDGALQVAVSKPAELVQKLSSLKESDPVAFKEVTGKVAEHFEKLSNLASGFSARALGQLAQRFASAAETGDLSAFAAFTPPQAPAPVAPPPAPAAPAPLDAGATALAMVDGLTSTGSNSGGDPVQRLTDLKTSDQAQFKRVMGKVAEQLEQLGNLTGGSDGESLQRLAATFASSAESGDLAGIEALRPPAPPAAPPPPAPPPPAPTPLDAGATARGIVDSLTSTLAPNVSGDALDKLGSLKSSDQATFKKVMGRAAEQLEQLANLSEGEDRDNLQSLALKFASGSESGDLSGLEQLKQPSTEPTPPPPPPPAPPSAPAPLDAKVVALSVLESLTSTGSGGGDPVAQLTSLKSSDLNSFKRVMNQAAQQLESMANLAEESDRAGLQQLAVSFASSAQSGDLAALTGLQPSPEPAPTPPSDPTPAPAPPAPIDARATAFSLVDTAVSGRSDLSGDALQKLDTLKSTDQATFRSVMGRVAEQLEQLGNLAEGDDRSSLLSMAATFASAAESRDLSGLTPSTPTAPESPAPEPAAPPWICNQARDAYARCASPRQELDDAFSSALALVDSMVSPASA